MTRKEMRRAKKKTTGTAQAAPPAPPTLKPVKPITRNQYRIVREFQRGQHLLIHGYAGTGKSYLALWLALTQMEAEEGPNRVAIVRSAVPSRSQGFLPGTDAEKMAVYEPPYRAIVDDLYRRSGHYNRLKDTKVLEFTSTSYLRGVTIDDTFIIADEIQNFTDGEMNTLMTRVGQNSRVMLLGDFRQNDLTGKHEKTCIGQLMDTVERMPSFSSIEMELEDIVRSGVVKEWIIARG